jgi:hypothetical protein
MESPATSPERESDIPRQGRGRVVIVAFVVAVLAMLAFVSFFLFRPRRSPPNVAGREVPGCVRPAPFQPPAPITPSQAASVDAVTRALAEGYFGVDAGAPTQSPERLAKELEARMRAERDTPMGRWQSTALRTANPGATALQCIDTIEVCADDRGGPGCCPRACIELHKRMCEGGKCDDPDREMKVFLGGVFAGECIAGFSEMMAPSRRMAEESTRRHVQEMREDHPLLYVGGSGIVVAQRRDGIIVSRDDGITWAPMNEWIDLVALRAVVETASRRVLAADIGHIYRWDEGAKRWIGREMNEPHGAITPVDQMCATRSGAVFFHADRMVWASRDDGGTWEQLPAVKLYAGALTMAISHQDELLVGTNGTPSIWRLRRDAWEAVVTDQHIREPHRIWPLPDGRLFVWGSDRRWVNPDGHVVPPTHDPPPGAGQLEWMSSLVGLVSHGGRLLALDHPAKPELWQSTDGAIWQRVPLPATCDPSSRPEKRWEEQKRCAIRSFASTRGGALLIGTTQRLMRSTDGETWTTVYRD